MEKLEFKNKDMEKIYNEKTERLKKLAEEPVYNEAYLWDKTVERYATNM